MKPGILVVSHGSREAEWVKLVDAAVEAAAAAVAGATANAVEDVEVADALVVGQGAASSNVPVVSAFLEIVEGRLIQDGIDQLEAMGVTDLFVIPLFVSSGSTHVEEIGQAFGMPKMPGSDFVGDLGTFRVQASVMYGKPIDDDQEIAELLLERISSLSVDATKEALLLIGHGSGEPLFYERWQSGLAQLGDSMRALGGFARSRHAMLLPDTTSATLRSMREEHPEESVIVVPVFLSQGYFTNTVIPKRLSGLDYLYNGRAMLPHNAIQTWLEKQMKSWLHRILRT